MRVQTVSRCRRPKSRPGRCLRPARASRRPKRQAATACPRRLRSVPKPRAPRQGGAVFFTARPWRLVFFARGRRAASFLILASLLAAAAERPAAAALPCSLRGADRTAHCVPLSGRPGIDFPTLLFSTAAGGRLPPARMRSTPTPRGGSRPETGARSSQLLAPSSPAWLRDAGEAPCSVSGARARDERLAAVRARHVLALRYEEEKRRRVREASVVMPSTMAAARSDAREKFI